MYKVIANVEELEQFRHETASVLSLWRNKPAVANIKNMAEKLDSNYGEDRDIAADLGGYIVIFYGNPREIEIEYTEILSQYSMPQDMYEYEKKYQNGEEETVVRLYLCSCDYAVVTAVSK